MTKTERKIMMMLKARLKSALVQLKNDAKDYDCTWPNNVIKTLEDCLKVIDDLKV